MLETYVKFIFAGIAVLMLGVGWQRRAHRIALWGGAVAAAGAALSANYNSFWPTVFLGALAVWATVTSLNFVDASWRLRFGLVGMVLSLGFLALWPSLHSMSGGKLPCPAWVQKQVGFKLVAGLDLRGGMRLTYTVEVDEAIKDKRDSYVQDIRADLARAYELHEGDDNPSEETLTKLREKVTVLPSKTERGKLTVKFTSAADADPNNGKFDARLRTQYPELNLKPLDGGVWDLTVKESAESSIRERAVAQAKEIILRRVDEMGLKEASVSTRDEDIIVEVPGEDESSFREIKEIIGQTARLEFKMLDDSADFFLGVKNSKTSLPEGIDFDAERTTIGQDEEGDALEKVVTFAVASIDEKDALPAKDGKKAQTAKNVALARLKQWVSTLDVPPGREVGFGVVRSRDPDTLKETETGWRTYYLKSRAEVTGNMVRDAQAQPDQSKQGLGGWFVGLRFTDRGGAIFDTITAANIKRRFAIILDKQVESAPVIQTRISGGSATITMGSGDPQVQLTDSRKLELVLRSGALPAPITENSQQMIGPSLGRDSIRLALQGALGGGILVIVFMLVYYRRAGIIANLSVGTNLFLQLAILATFGASMTLPGIAGLALTIGMSVDSNVLINERIREEIRDGKSPRAAVDVGYGKALSAIVDGHLTTLIAAVVLAQYGTGPIKGFAVTLFVGTMTSIFSGVVVSRVLFDFWVHGRRRDATLDMG